MYVYMCVKVHYRAQHIISFPSNSAFEPPYKLWRFGVALVWTVTAGCQSCLSVYLSALSIRAVEHCGTR